MPDLPVGESDPLAPLLPFLRGHTRQCAVNGWTTGAGLCDCGGLGAALAEVRASVPTLSDDGIVWRCIRDPHDDDAHRWVQGFQSDGGPHVLCGHRPSWDPPPALAVICARFPDLGDQ